MNFKKAGWIVFVFVVLTVLLHLMLNFIVPFNGCFNKSWAISENSGTKEIDLPVKLDGNQSLQIKKVIPVGSEGKSLYFYTSEQTVRAFINDKVIYEYGKNYDNRPFAKSPGNVWNEIQIKKEYEGKMLSIIFTYPYEHQSGHIWKFYLTRPRIFFSYLIRKYFLSLLFSFFCATSFVLILSFRSVFKSYFGSFKQILYISLYAIFVAIWYFVNNKFILFAVNYPKVIHAISIICLMVIDLPALLYAIEIREFRLTKFVKLYIISKCAIVFLVILAEIFALIDIYSLRNIIHIFIYSSVMIFFITLGIAAIRDKRKDLLEPFALYLFLVLVSSIDMVIVKVNAEEYSANFASFASVVFISFLVAIAIKNITKVLNENEKASLYKNLASQDFMTGTKNKSAFLNDIEKLIFSEKLSAVVFDINELKVINDNYGHEKGDAVVILVSDTVKNIYGKFGACYRTGTDEFTVLIQDNRKVNIYSLIENFFLALNIASKDLPCAVGVAVGYESFNQKIDKSFKDTVRRAKQKMSANKNSQKLAEEV